MTLNQNVSESPVLPEVIEHFEDSSLGSEKEGS
jgi:hypothetical protein